MRQPVSHEAERNQNLQMFLALLMADGLSAAGLIQCFLLSFVLDMQKFQIWPVCFHESTVVPLQAVPFPVRKDPDQGILQSPESARKMNYSFYSPSSKLNLLNPESYFGGQAAVFGFLPVLSEVLLAVQLYTGLCRSCHGGSRLHRQKCMFCFPSSMSMGLIYKPICL